MLVGIGYRTGDGIFRNRIYCSVTRRLGKALCPRNIRLDIALPQRVVENIYFRPAFPKVSTYVHRRQGYIMRLFDAALFTGRFEHCW
jgi:hypothetical protein